MMGFSRSSSLNNNTYSSRVLVHYLSELHILFNGAIHVLLQELDQRTSGDVPMKTKSICVGKSE